MAVTLTVLLLGGCGAEPESSAATDAIDLTEGLWRAEVDQFGHLLPFNFEIARDGDGWAVTYLNGPERMPVEEVRYDGRGALELNFPSYSSGLSAQVTGARMSGEIHLRRRDEVHRLPFTAAHGEAHRFFADPAEIYVDVSGRWEVTMQVPALDFSQPAVAIFEQDGPNVAGTVQTKVGDYRFLFGEVRDDALYLSTFDGGGTQLWTATLLDDGMLSGSFHSATYKTGSWRAQRNPEFKLADPTTLTWLKPGYDRMEFTLPDLEGRPVSLSQPRFQGKVILVVIAGSWCSTCHDEARFMVPYYRENRDRGLAVIYLMFEYSNEIDAVRDQILAFRDRYGIEHDILFAGDSSAETRSARLPMLNDIVAFPTTLFIDRQGQVRRIHTAFPGPATGQAHEDYKREFRAFMEMLLTEPV